MVYSNPRQRKSLKSSITPRFICLLLVRTTIFASSSARHYRLDTFGHSLDLCINWYYPKDHLRRSFSHSFSNFLLSHGLVMHFCHERNADQNSHGRHHLASSRRDPLHSWGHFLCNAKDSLHARHLALFCLGWQYLPLFCSTFIFSPIPNISYSITK